ncbi:inner membrane protein YqiJ [Thioploca ingrica]|uniref:Inner membrane protein YqiJ n=1 Tax=Thioploca ingrica TaxID=40754 RepID=A0A090AAU5_9GAMM|nr:inner membrane protein YqiJ [Thioploca ingrica]
MLTFILDSHNFPFTIALLTMVGIALLEGITTLLGFGLSSLLGHFLPDIDAQPDLDVDHPDADTSLGHLLGWINVGRVPLMVLLVIFLTVFGLLGYTLQAIFLGIVGQMLPTLLAALLSLFLSLPVVRFLGKFLGKLMPNDETEAISEETFIGRIATITLGTATKGRPARAKFQDNYGTTHLVMVEPENTAEVFNQGDKVVLLERLGGKFLAARNINPLLEK